MPELPEVETTRRGIEPHLLGQQVTNVIVREKRLRWPIPAALTRQLPGQTIATVQRRAKYLLLKTANDHTLILHLGMSGSLRVVPIDTPVQKHDHLDVVLDNGLCLRLRDPRRFGAALWTTKDAAQHKLIKALGPEPLGDAFDSDYLMRQLQRRSSAIKNVIMDASVVVGVGNIYASEALFRAGIHPKRTATQVSRARIEKLVAAIKQVLDEAITQGGTTLRDFAHADGSPGYFAQSLDVYGREGEDCHHCKTTIKRITLGNRSSFYCPHCQH